MYWKQFVVWATALKNRYGSDPFFRSEFNVISLQVLFATSLVVLAVVAHNKLSFWSFITIVSIITVVFSYFIAHFTLSPVRNAIKLQKRFISDIAHELRTPLSVIKTNTEVAMIGGGIESKLKKMLESNIEELDRTSDIINNLLSFSNLIRPDRINFGPMSLGLVVDGAMKRMKDLANKKKLDVSVKKIGADEVWGNFTALEQIVINLVKNAISYTPHYGRVLVKIEPDYLDNIVLSIIDSGIGIESKDLAHIFEPFYRAERSRNREHGSSGLGLTIVSELVKLHAGKIIIKSEPNKGTEVFVWFPRNKKGASQNRDNTRSNQVSMNFLDRSRH